MVGGGDWALLETLELVGHGVEVVLVDADASLSGQETYAGRVRESAQVEVRHNTVLEEILGDGHVEGVRVREPRAASRRSCRSRRSSSTPAVSRTPRSWTESWRWTSRARAHGHVDANRASGPLRRRRRAGGRGRPGDHAAGDGATAAIAAHRYLAHRVRRRVRGRGCGVRGVRGGRGEDGGVASASPLLPAFADT